MCTKGLSTVALLVVPYPDLATQFCSSLVYICIHNIKINFALTRSQTQVFHMAVENSTTVSPITSHFVNFTIFLMLTYVYADKIMQSNLIIYLGIYIILY